MLLQIQQVSQTQPWPVFGTTTIPQVVISGNRLSCFNIQEELFSESSVSHQGVNPEGARTFEAFQEYFTPSPMSFLW